MRKTKLIYDQSNPLEFDKLKDGVQRSLMLDQYDFTRFQTSSTCRFKLRHEKIDILPKIGELSGHGAAFVGRVKSHFAEIDLPERLSTDRPFYEYFVPISTYQELTDVVEVDINGAYWESAHQLGYIPGDIYKSADKVGKKVRLISLGVLGKKTVITQFKPPYDQIIQRERYEKTRVFWDNIVFNLGESIREVTERYKPHIFGIWFDAIFCTKASAGNIRRFLQRRGYETKIKPIRSYIVRPRNEVVPGATIERIFMDGTVKKEMYVNYNEKGTMNEFLEKLS